MTDDKLQMSPYYELYDMLVSKDNKYRRFDELVDFTMNWLASIVLIMAVMLLIRSFFYYLLWTSDSWSWINIPVCFFTLGKVISDKFHYTTDALTFLFK